MDIPDISAAKRRVNLSGLIPLSACGLIAWSYLTGGAQNLCRPLETTIPMILSSGFSFQPEIQQALLNCQSQNWVMILMGIFALISVFVAADFFIWPTNMINTHKELRKSLLIRRLILLPYLPVLVIYLKALNDQYSFI